MLYRTRAARGDNRYMHGIIYPLQKSVIKPAFGTIMVHRRKEYFASASAFGFQYPVECFFFGGNAAAVQMYQVLIAYAPGIHRNHHQLYPECLGQFVYQLRVTHRSRIDRYFIRTGIQQSIGIGYLVNSPTDGKRYIDL